MTAPKKTTRSKPNLYVWSHSAPANDAIGRLLVPGQVYRFTAEHLKHPVTASQISEGLLIESNPISESE